MHAVLGMGKNPPAALYARQRYMVCVCFWFCEFPSEALCVPATLKSRRKISWSATQRKKWNYFLLSEREKSATAQFAATCGSFLSVFLPWCLIYSLELLLSHSLACSALLFSQSVWELYARNARRERDRGERCKSRDSLELTSASWASRKWKRIRNGFSNGNEQLEREKERLKRQLFTEHRRVLLF